MLTSLDLFLVCLAVLIMALGFRESINLLRSGLPEKCSGDRSSLIKYILGHKKILKNPFRGILHLIVFWGCVLPVIVIIFAQTRLTLPGLLASVLSFLLDIVGLIFLVATIIFFIRRLISKDTLGPEKGRSLLPLFVLIIILVTGFLAEGFRISITGPGNIWAAPAGYVVSLSLTSSPVMMQLMIRTHFFLVLLLLAITPFTFFRHIILASLNTLYKRKGNTGEFKIMPSKNGPPGANHVKDFTWKQLLDTEACVSCGRCEENCPAFISGKPLSPRKIVRRIYELLHSKNSKSSLDSCISADEIWACTTCMACVEACPVFVAPLDKIVDMRRHLTMGRGVLPPEAVTMIRNLEIYGDANGKGIAARADWAMNRGVKVTKADERDVEIVIWTGCSGAFHPRYQDVSRALVRILQKAGINFRILGSNELCCGDPARRLGEEDLFLNLAGKNLKTFREHNVNKIITLCPHCYNTLKNEYPKIETADAHEFEVIHAAQYIMGLIAKKLVIPEFPFTKSVTLHDPCYLGRGNNVNEPLRDIIKNIPGTSLTELDRCRENGFCCGAGGGGMWLHEHLGKRLNIIRSEEIVEKNVDVVCTACPYCQTMISDGINGMELENPPDVLDIIEMVERALR